MSIPDTAVAIFIGIVLLLLILGSLYLTVTWIMATVAQRFLEGDTEEKESR